MLEFDKLAKLKETDPEKYWEVICELMKNLPEDEDRQFLRVTAAADNGLSGFRAFYELMHGEKLLPHNDKQVDRAFQSFELNEIYVYLGFRGCRKTTTLGITLGAFLHGHYPNETAVTTGAADPNAKLIAKSIAQIIELHPEFRATFPHVIPYKERGWGAEGYWIRDNRITVEEWARQQAKVNDPSFVGGGYKSSEINGKHPSLYLLVDDLHDIDSSVSVTEREYIKKVFFTQIMPTIIKGKTKVIMTGVPFAHDDTYATLEQSSGVSFEKIPVMKRAAEGKGVYIDGKNPKTGVVYDDIVGWWILTEPRLMNVEQIINERSHGKGAFWQMYMIDIDIAKTQGIRYYLKPKDEVGFDLPTAGGADPTMIDPDYEVGGKKRSSFALCYLCKMPNGTLVVKGGVLKPMGIAKAKEAILQAQSMFKHWITTMVEGVGVGKTFQQFLRLDNRVIFRDSNIANPKGIVKDKMKRFDDEIAPWLEAAVLLISDEENDFNMALRKLCDNFFDIDPRRPDDALDAGDALYHAVKAFPEVLRNYTLQELAPTNVMASMNKGGLWHPMLGVKNG